MAFYSVEGNHLYNIGREYTRKNSVKLFSILDRRFRRKCYLMLFLSRARAVPMFGGEESFVQFC